MSDESESSAASRSIHEPAVQNGGSTSTQSQISVAQRKLRALFSKKRIELLDDLIRDLDILVFAELSIIYYMDCHFFRFALRAIVQFMFLTPKPVAFPRPPKPEPYVGAILGSNLLCLLLHLFGKAPAAGEGTRFYLHGGLILDFIGQKGPSSKIVLMLLDLFVVSLQLVHLSAHITKMRLKDGIVGHVASVLATTVQDIDSEERGVRRSDEIQRRDAQDNIELQNLDHAGRTAPEGSALLAQDDARQDTLSSPRLDTFILESFWNGQIVLADLDPIRTAKEQIIHYQQTPIETRRSALNEQLAARMSEFRFLTRGRR